MTTLAESLTIRRALSQEAKTIGVERQARKWGIKVGTEACCEGHSAPIDFLTAWVYDRPDLSLVLGPRGGGKSYLRAFATHIDSIDKKRHSTRILGGSLAQSEQIYNALSEFNYARPGYLKRFTKTMAHYHSGSDVSLLAASATSVRGPHVPTLCLDEIDEMDTDIREAALGMSMERHGVSGSVSMTSTWHRIGGPMEKLIERAREGDFPFYQFCVFEVLERCPEERSGPALENCPECPLVKWCHDSRDGIPKAKRSNGHYRINDLIQKTRGVSARVFEADYLCTGPRADGIWFTQFDEARNVNEIAEYDTNFPVHLANDSGVVTGAVLYQVIPQSEGLHHIHVFADYLSEGLSAELNGRALLRLVDERCNGKIHKKWTDPAGGARNPVGPTVLKEYERVGLPLRPWPVGTVADGLAVVESSVRAADGSQRLWIHPRCRNLINAFRGYRRAKRAGQWMDYPEDPQHPHEDLMDALRGGIVADEVPKIGRPAAGGARPAFATSRDLSRGI